ncbi:MAG TPA: hypothetical protein VHL31_06065 [Geminicoccus sp.]|jgi:hypothetical protein|uniref:hypothetical protein n=1 Tax=Geminicoccus sp. TaxID=2024832 RepID=UPI002E2F7E87|nr:hypothetical protein [Geminicoccus sp.]HEX2525855.1 hypothetical protein [Geminicoccus sp.]
MTCQCASCLLGRLQGNGNLLSRGRTSMAASALGTVVTELGEYVAKAKVAAPVRHPVRPLTGAAMAMQRAGRLRHLLAARPELQAEAARVLRVRPADIAAISEGRVLLTPQNWRKLFDALEPAERPTDPTLLQGDTT